MSVVAEIANESLALNRWTAIDQTAASGQSSQGEEKRGATYSSAPTESVDTRYAFLRLPHPAGMAVLRSSLERHGVLHPLVVNREGDDLVLLDGFKRLSILSEQKKAVVPIRVMRLGVEQAKAALVTFNRPHRGLCELEEAWVVASLVREHGLRQVDVAELLGHHKSWVCRRLQLAERLEKGVVEDMRLGLVSARVAREVVRLPRGPQPTRVEAVRRHGLTSRQTNALVDRLLDSDEDEWRTALLADPLRFLGTEPISTRASRSRDPRLSDAGEKLRQVLVGLEHQAMMVQRALRAPRSEPLRGSDREVLGAMANAVVPLLEDDIDALRALGEATEAADDEA